MQISLKKNMYILLYKKLWNLIKAHIAPGPVPSISNLYVFRYLSMFLSHLAQISAQLLMQKGSAFYYLSLWLNKVCYKRCVKGFAGLGTREGRGLFLDTEKPKCHLDH